MKIHKSYFALVGLILILTTPLLAQEGIRISSSRMYYKVPAGGSAIQKLTVTNPSDKPQEVGISLSDWAYDSTGNNLTFEAGTQTTTCADWIQILPGAYFTLAPKEKKELSIRLNVPQNANSNVPVHNAMLFFTQLTPSDRKTNNGATMKISVRIGVKLYHCFTQQEDRDIEITDFRDLSDSTKATEGSLELGFHNLSKIWVEGKVTWELLNSATGDKKNLDDTYFYSLPGDIRILQQVLPSKLPHGRYTATAIVNYGNKSELKIAELEFVR